MEFRDRFIPKPEDVKTILVLESPPAPVGGNYFYKTDGKISEPLFRALMKVIFPKQKIKTKCEGLRKFKEAGYALVDATYIPVNKMKNRRNTTITKSFDELVKDLRKIIGNKNHKVRIILIKANIRILLEKKLLTEKFMVVNNGTTIPFPSHGWQRKFASKLRRFIRICR